MEYVKDKAVTHHHRFFIRLGWIRLHHAILQGVRLCHRAHHQRQNSRKKEYFLHFTNLACKITKIIRNAEFIIPISQFLTWKFVSLRRVRCGITPYQQNIVFLQRNFTL